MSDSSTSSASPQTKTMRPPSPPAANEKRVSLACLRCRTKRARCSGDKPVCRACEKAKEDCVWPTGRRRKRTRKEMEEEERRERLASAAADSMGHRDKRSFSSHSTGWAQNEPLSIEPYPESIPWEHSVPAWRHDVAQPSTFGDGRTGDYSHPRQIPFSEATSSPSDDQFSYLNTQASPVGATPSNVNRLSLKLSGAHPSIPPATSLVRHNSNPSPPSPAARELDDMFDEIGLPYPHLYHPLLDTFFSTLSRHFPSISRKRIEERLESGTMSPFFLNCICALAARFLPSARDDPSRACAPYIAKAQELIIVLIHLPTTDVVTGLLLLSWASYGQNSESGLWEYSGMAIRMAMDLGLHEVYEPYLSKAHVTRARLLFWSLFVTDRILAFSKGRPPTIPEEIIEIPLPVHEDFVPDPARADADENELPQPIPFVHMVRLMVLCGRITTVLTGCRGETRTLMPHVMKEHPQKLKALREELAQFYADLKDLMRWSVDAFKHQEARGHGDSFLTLHLWANAILAVSFYPELQERPEGNFAPITQNVERSTKLALASSRVIAECLVFADLFASHSYLTSPFVVEPIYVASLAFINDMKSAAMHSTSEDQPTQTVDNLLSTLARQNLAVLSKAVHRMEHYWVGISTISDIVEQHAAGLGFQRIDSSRKSRLNVSMPDIVLPDSPPIFTNAYTQRQSAILPSQITNSTLPVAMMLDSGESNNSPSQTVNLQPFKGDYKSSGAFALLVGLDGMHFTDYNSSEASLSDGTTTSSQSFSTRIEA